MVPVNGVVAWVSLGHVAGFAIGPSLGLQLLLQLLSPASPVAPAVAACPGCALASETSPNPLTLLGSLELSSVLPLPPLDPTKADPCPRPERAMVALEASSGWGHEEVETRAPEPSASASQPSLLPRRAAAAAASQNAMAREIPGVRVEVAAAAVAARGRDCCCYLLLGVWEKVVVTVVVAKVGLLHRCHLLLPSSVTSVS